MGTYGYFNMKFCTQCSVEREVICFSKNKRQGDGLHTQCKKCNAENYKNNKAHISTIRKARYYRDAEVCREYSRQWYAENKEKSAIAVTAWVAANPDKSRGIKAAWASRNVGKVKAASAKRRHNLKRAIPPWQTESDKKVIEGMYAMAARLTTCTGILHHVDHIHPLRGETVCGLHVPLNLQVIPATLNLRKGNKLHEYS